MTHNSDWVTVLVTDARQRHASVTEAVAARIHDMLNGQLGERQLTSTELEHLAEALIMDMTRAPPVSEPKQ